jgi:hypothetical protein
LLLRWNDLCDMFGGELAVKDFKKVFPNDLRAAQISYPGAKIEPHEEGFVFRASQPPVPKVIALVK